MDIKDIDVGIIAKAFAHSGDDEQSEFINTFGKELFVACKGGHKYETQCCYLSDKLDNHGIKLIKMIFEFIELRENEPN